MSPEERDKIIGELAALWPEAGFTPEELTTFSEQIATWDFDAVRSAVKRHWSSPTTNRGIRPCFPNILDRVPTRGRGEAKRTVAYLGRIAELRQLAEKANVTLPDNPVQAVLGWFRHVWEDQRAGIRLDADGQLQSVREETLKFTRAAVLHGCHAALMSPECRPPGMAYEPWDAQALAMARAIVGLDPIPGAAQRKMEVAP